MHDCRTDNYYNEKYLVGEDERFVQGYDCAVEQIITMFSNIDVYPELEKLLGDDADVVEEAVSDWAESYRNDIIVSMIDDMPDDLYTETKRAVDRL